MDFPFIDYSEWPFTSTGWPLHAKLNPGLRQGDAGRPDHVRITGTNAWCAALWMDEIGKKNIDQPNTACTTSSYIILIEFPTLYVESTVISYIQQLIAMYYIVYYITKITRLLERYRFGFSTAWNCPIDAARMTPGVPKKLGSHL